MAGGEPVPSQAELDAEARMKSDCDATPLKPPQAAGAAAGWTWWGTGSLPSRGPAEPRPEETLSRGDWRGHGNRNTHGERVMAEHPTRLRVYHSAILGPPLPRQGPGIPRAEGVAHSRKHTLLVKNVHDPGRVRPQGLSPPPGVPQPGAGWGPPGRDTHRHTDPHTGTLTQTHTDILI